MDSSADPEQVRPEEPDTYVPVDSDEVEDAYRAANADYVEVLLEQQRRHVQSKLDATEERQ